MNVSDLIERLQECDPDAEVLLAHQEGWPLQFTVRGVATSDDVAADAECDEHCHYNCADCAEQSASTVYLVEGVHPAQPYAPRAVWEVAS